MAWVSLTIHDIAVTYKEEFTTEIIILHREF